jgi:hypothetical protein
LDFLDFLRSGETDIAAFADSRQKTKFDGDIQVPKPRRLADDEAMGAIIR